MAIIERPTLVVNETRARLNIARMAEKARRCKLRFRPHFKTHQSAAVGEWFRQQGVNAITVSSVDMAAYFANHGWDDIVIAFPFNPRQANAIHTLAQQVHLGLLVDDACSQEKLPGAAEIWLEIDDGTGRSGIAWERADLAFGVAASLRATESLRLRGLLTHAGRIYRSQNPTEIRQTYHQTVDRINQVRDFLHSKGLGPLEVSVGDTPGCSLVDDFGKVDEIRPGNFVFYDVQQLQMGVCTAGDIALAVACPVVARYPEREEVVIYGGAVHLSKDTVVVNGQNTFGLVALESAAGWSDPLPGAFVARLTQEHGVIHLPGEYASQVQVGDLVYVLPAHSCLAVSALREVQTLDGKVLPVMSQPA